MDVRPLDLDDLDAALDVRARSFGPLTPSGEASWRSYMQAAISPVLAVYDGSRVAGFGAFHRMRQWWHGRDVPMAGVASVVVGPEDRGRGVGRLLMTGIIERIAAEGFPVSMLYPQTAPLYRSLGWEIAGVQPLVTIPGEALRTIAADPVKLRQVGVDDLPEIMETERRVHAATRDCGPIEFPEELLRFWMSDDKPFAYLADDGYLEYNWAGKETLFVQRVLALSEQTSRALWALVGSGSSVARTVRASVAPHDPVRLLTREPVVVPDGPKPWMLRIVDAAAAIATRGFAAGIEAEGGFAVDDPQLPGNEGPWRLTVSGGSGELERARADAGLLRLTAGGFAALYGGAPLAALRRAGLASGGDPADDPLLDSAFAATAYCLDYF